MNNTHNHFSYVNSELFMFLQLLSATAVAFLERFLFSTVVNDLS